MHTNIRRRRQQTRRLCEKQAHRLQSHNRVQRGPTPDRGEDKGAFQPARGHELQNTDPGHQATHSEVHGHSGSRFYQNG